MKNLLIRKYLIIGAVVILVLLLLSIVFSNYYYRITINGGDGSNRVIAVTSDNSESTITTLFGISIIPRSTQFIVVTSENMRTNSTITERPLLGLVDKTINLEPQKKLTKKGRNDLGCITQNSSGIYTYRCADGEKIFKLPDLDTDFSWSNELSGDIVPGYFWQEKYQQGVLFAYRWIDDDEYSESLDEQITLRYYTFGVGDVQESHLLSMDTSIDDRLTLTTDALGGQGFLINNLDTGISYYYKNLSSQPLKITRSSPYNNLGDEGLCSLSGDYLACYYGEPSESPDSLHESETATATNKERHGDSGSFEYYDLSKDEISPINYRYSGVGLHKICLANKNELYTINAETLIRYRFDSQESPQKEVFNIGARSLSCGENILFSTTDSVYRINGDDAISLFTNERFSISGVWQYGQSPLFSMFLGGDEASPVNSSHVYSIDLSKPSSSISPESILPLSQGSDVPIFDMDYTDSTIYIQPSISVISDHQTGETIIDEDELSVTKRQIEDYLNSKGVSKLDKSIVYRVGQ